MGSLGKLCDKLAEEWKIEEGFATDVEGLYSLPLGDDLELLVDENDQGIYINCSVDPLPKEGREERIRSLLLSNYLGCQTRGATIGLDDREQVCLNYQFREEPDYLLFSETVDDFIQTVDDLRDYLRGDL